MAGYLDAPKVVALREEKVYVATTTESFNSEIRSGNEIYLQYVKDSALITFAHKIALRDGEGLSAQLAWNTQGLPNPVIFVCTRRTESGRTESEGAVMPLIPY
ncbi:MULTISPECIES: hypothetical protein [unclassified Pseudomonas]|jgi:hypothetical protein|uniref:hypothetical protein n=1 Tax=unclassified Pseudomonas TaxID=196821 RepID=UPI001A935359|nr:MULTISPECIES: hypothetical protein [unclassified Pseudomonas]